MKEKKKQLPNSNNKRDNRSMREKPPAYFILIIILGLSYCYFWQSVWPKHLLSHFNTKINKPAYTHKSSITCNAQASQRPAEALKHLAQVIMIFNHRSWQQEAKGQDRWCSSVKNGWWQVWGGEAQSGNKGRRQKERAASHHPQPKPFPPVQNAAPIINLSKVQHQ